MFGMGFHEFLLLVLVIAVLSMTGLWPSIIQGIRELRGDAPPSHPRNAEKENLFYQLLGVSPSASWEEIERAYRQKARIHHPDRGGDADTMRALNEAYDCLKRMRRPKRGSSGAAPPRSR